ncbi:DUF6096 family protein [Turicibacter sanguinis]|uniref:DUF6096 family protein n=1 Tax=Turicibacter sanguinis TaxID=154288 RepID=UPI0018A888DB|nr:DUF6096 family protein [Turicibacter sanguinis]MDB8553880.1 DUF6096 family protein [Turicibacter sanguinis]
MKAAIWTVKGTEYQLRMKARQCGMLETKIGNPLNLLMKVELDHTLPALPHIVTIIAHAMLMHHPGMNENKIYQLIDEWLEEGHTQAELIELTTEILKVSGYIPSEELADEQ